MGILPLQFVNDESADKLKLTGKEKFSLELNKGELKVGQIIDIKLDNGSTFKAKVRLDTVVEIAYFKNGGILPYVLRKLAKKKGATAWLKLNSW